MGRNAQLASLVLPDMAGGIDRLDEERPSTCADALDVVSDEGEVERRQAFRSFATAAPHLMPAGLGIVVVNDVAYTNRNPAIGAASTIYVGNAGLQAAAERFDGIEWGLVALTGAFTAHRRLVVSYWNGAAWVAVPWFYDDTREINAGFFQPLAKNGRIAWHLSQFSSSWATSTIAAFTGYWMRLTITDVDGVTATLQGTRTISAPGIRLLQFAPVNGLFPVRIEGQDSLIVCSDRVERRGMERGAMLGSKRRAFDQTDTLRIVLDEGGGFYGVITWPDWARDGTALGTGGGTTGTAARITKILQQFYDAALNAVVPFRWMTNQFLGGAIRGSITNGNWSSSSQVANLFINHKYDREFEHCRLRCTASPTSPINVGDEREVYYSTSNSTLFLYDAFPGLGDTSDVFDLLLPPSVVLVDPGGRVYDIYANTNHELDLVGDRPYARNDEATALLAWMGGYQVLQEPRWVVSSGERYSGAMDPVTGRLILTNGGELFETDGKVLRRLKADFDSTSATEYSGRLTDRVSTDQELNPSTIALSKLRRAPPQGRYIAFFQGRLFVTGDVSHPYSLFWSAPGGFNNIWPLLFEGFLRDQEQNPITGVYTLHDRLIVSTSTNIHEAVGPTEEGVFDFKPISQGYGFVAQQAVAVIAGAESSMLVGVAPDGITAFNGNDPRQVLDRWDRIIRGVNTERLHLAVAVAAPQRNCAYFAVPEKGSDSNNRILRWNYRKNTWWVWSAPFGVSAMAIDYDQGGQERVLIGTDDGFVAQLQDGPDDDGTVITGFAITQVIQPLQGQAFSPVELALTLRAIGKGSLSLDLYAGDDTDLPLQAATLYVDKGGLQYGGGGSFTAQVAAGARFIKRSYKTIQARVRTGIRAHRLQVKLSGTSRWALQNMELKMKPREHRGRR